MVTISYFLRSILIFPQSILVHITHTRRLWRFYSEKIAFFKSTDSERRRAYTRAYNGTRYLPRRDITHQATINYSNKLARQIRIYEEEKEIRIKKNLYFHTRESVIRSYVSTTRWLNRQYQLEQRRASGWYFSTQLCSPKIFKKTFQIRVISWLAVYEYENVLGRFSCIIYTSLTLRLRTVT